MARLAALAFALVLALPASAQSLRVFSETQTEAQRIDDRSERFGFGLAVEGDRMLVNGPSAFGYVRVLEYQRTPAGWVEVGYIDRPVSEPNALGSVFGYSIALDGDRAIVGDAIADSLRGAAYVFERAAAPGGWAFVAELVPDGGTNENERFGERVTLSGDHALVKGYYENYVRVFTRDPDTGAWLSRGTFDPADVGNPNYRFRGGVVVDGDVALVEANTTAGAGDIRSGVVHLLRWDPVSEAWAGEELLAPPDGVIRDSFGTLAIEGDRVLIGAPYHDHDGVIDTGGAYLFEYDGTAWSFVTELVAPGLARERNFGTSVELDGDVALVTGQFRLPPEARQGDAHLFRKVRGEWVETDRFRASTPETALRFGSSAELSGGQALIGAYEDETAGGPVAGAVYAFPIGPITPGSAVVAGGRGARYLGPPAAGMTVDDLAAQNLVRGVPGYFPDASGTTLYTRYDRTLGRWLPSAGAGEPLGLGRAFRWDLLDREAVGDSTVSISRVLPFLLEPTAPVNEADVTLALGTTGNRINHLANPFGEPLALGGASTWPGGAGIRSQLYVYDPARARWRAWAGAVGPWQAFRFRAAPPRRDGGARLLTIPASARDPLADLDDPGDVAAAHVAFRLEARGLDGRPLGDGMLTVSFEPGASTGFSVDEDLEKFQPPATAYALVGARVGGAFVGHDARPFAPAEIPLGLEARGTASAFTLSWEASRLPDGLPVTLVDLVTGLEVDVRSRSSLQFEAASRPALVEIPTDDLADGAAATDRFVLRIGDALASEPAVTELGLEAPRPTPTAGAARVVFAVPEAGPVRLAAYDVRGREVAVLVDGRLEAGRHEAGLDAGPLAAGVYVLRLEVGGEVRTARAVVAR